MLDLMPLLQLTREHADHSTDRGYQFEFFCDRCAHGFISNFRPFVMVMSGGVGSAQAAGALPSHESVFRDSIAEIEPHLRHCGACGHWVCASSCWNAERAVCRDCAP